MRLGAPQLSTARLALNRFELFLRSPYGSAEHRTLAEQTIRSLRQQQGQAPYESIAEILSTGAVTSEEPAADLQSRARDDARPLLERVGFAYQAGMAFEKANLTADALAAYRQAFDLLKTTYPVWAGTTKGGIESSRPRTLAHEPEEPRFLRHLASTIRRLDPDTPELLRGGLRLRLTGVDLSPDFGLNLAIVLWNPDSTRGIQITDVEEVPNSFGAAPLQLDHTAWVGVADGRYRLKVYAGSRCSRASGQANRQFHMLHLDFRELPREVEIHGETIDLPPIHAQLVDIVNLAGPADDAAVDPQKTVLKWHTFPLATKYTVTLWRTERTPGGGTYFRDSYTAETTKPELSLAEIPRSDAERLQLITAGTKGAWSVEAFDSEGRWLARSRDSRRFVIQNSTVR